jgi:hypothetical protein
MNDRQIAGRLLHHGAPEAGCQVLAADEATSSVVDDVVTGSDGSWQLGLPDGTEKVLVFARCRGDALGVAFREAVAGIEALDLEISAVAPTHELTVGIEGAGMEDWVTPKIMLTPLRIDGVDERLLRWIHAPVRGFSGGPLIQLTPPDRRLRRFVQAGRWWLSAEFELVPDARAEGMPDSIRWRAVSARTADGSDLSTVRGGFAFEVGGPVSVTVTMERVD